MAERAWAGEAAIRPLPIRHERLQADLKALAGLTEAARPYTRWPTRRRTGPPATG